MYLFTGDKYSVSLADRYFVAFNENRSASALTKDSLITFTEVLSTLAVVPAHILQLQILLT